ncbi:hypothetical protein [Nocardia xishanensis]|uniref:hypothetical protein n=1 Tax=Nocardia xishanensis TaxID=238964 RepID=UPI00342B0A7F
MFFDGMPGNWEPMPLAQAIQRYDIGEASDDSVYLEDLFGDEPEHFYVHTGDIVVDGPLVLGNGPGEEEDTVYVVDGNLTVDGPVSFLNMDIYTSLYVTGSLKARDLICLWDSCLFIGGSLHIDQLLATALTDAGHLVVKKAVSAQAWLDDCDRGAIYFDDVHVPRRIGASGNSYLGADHPIESRSDTVRTEFFDESGQLDMFRMRTALIQGLPVLR